MPILDSTCSISNEDLRNRRAGLIRKDGRVPSDPPKTKSIFRALSVSEPASSPAPRLALVEAPRLGWRPGERARSLPAELVGRFEPIWTLTSPGPNPSLQQSCHPGSEEVAFGPRRIRIMRGWRFNPPRQSLPMPLLSDEMIFHR